MKRTLLALFLLIGAACGKDTLQVSAPPPPLRPATTLTYTDPPPYQGWRLIKDPASTPDHLLLNLYGPQGLKTRGAAFNLQLPPGVTARSFPQTRHPVRDMGVYELLNAAPLHGPDPLEPVLVAGGLKPGNLLTVGEFQKDRRVTAKESGVALFQIALELDPSAPVASGSLLVPVVKKAKYMAEDSAPSRPTPTRSWRPRRT
jgi:hypothetical protein